MKSGPDISVIISTYNRAKFLPRVLNSVLTQTFTNFELILVNNGSTDNTQALCEEYAEKDKRIKLVSIAENHGAPQGRNVGLDVASCEYLTMIDDDDYCEPEMLQFMWNLASKYNADISMCGSWDDYDGRLVTKYIFDETLVLDRVQGLDELLKREKFSVAPPTKLIRRRLYDDIRYPRDVLVDDIHVLYKIFAKADLSVAKGTPLYHFMKHDSNMTSFMVTNVLSPDLLDEYLEVYRTRTQYLCSRVPEITPRARYSVWSYMISMCNKIKIYNCEGCEKQYDYMIQQIKENYDEFINSPFITEKEKQLCKEHIK
ncbi:MAG TPA: glycosyltransferase family 2 protein [Ruminiclostridium sp.]|nr:glycosyltransferase family 2 protein [Ruminiclostridium sp.]